MLTDDEDSHWLGELFLGMTMDTSGLLIPNLIIQLKYRKLKQKKCTSTNGRSVLIKYSDIIGLSKKKYKSNERKEKKI